MTDAAIRRLAQRLPRPFARRDLVLPADIRAGELAGETNHPRIRIIVDFFRLATEGEDPQILRKVRDQLIHLHFSNPGGGRSFPRDVREHPAYGAFFASLRAIDYQGRPSLEANTRDFASDAPAGLAAVRKLYSAACQG